MSKDDILHKFYVNCAASSRQGVTMKELFNASVTAVGCQLECTLQRAF
jgi:hypothetical protein